MNPSSPINPMNPANPASPLNSSNQPNYDNAIPSASTHVGEIFEIIMSFIVIGAFITVVVLIIVALIKEF